MGKDAISSTKKEISPASSSGDVTASPLIFIIAVFAVILIGLYFFKDRIFKNKSKNLSDLKQESTPEPKETNTEIEKVTEP